MKDRPVVPNNPAPGNPPQPKIGDGHAAAWMRQGLAEARAALYTGSNIAQPAEYGLYGHQTPGEIAADRKPDPTPTLEEEPVQSPLQQSMKEAESRSQDRSPTRERDQNKDRDR